jgi:hypothetical protein
MADTVTEAPRVRRSYNKLVNNPVLEDYSLRYAPKSFRTWSSYAVSAAALGGIAYLADQAIGGSLAVQFGFQNASWGILAAALVIFLTGIPIAYHCTKYNVDVDLLTRGAGFGYLGSTITSVIYASFTFIFFALEGSIMAQAFLLYFGIPLPVGYALGSLIIIPLVVFGMTLLAKLQVWTQPVWLILLFSPPVAVLVMDPNAYSGSLSWSNFFSRLLHAHPGRVVYIFFNVAISLTMMELNMFSVLGAILGFYSNVAVAWIGAVTADLVINKPLKLSPPHIEFKRAHLYNFNPVGFGAMAIASLVSIVAFFGVLGPACQAFSAFIALALGFCVSPIIAYTTKGRYYLARNPYDASHIIRDTMTCVSCGYDYEKPDMTGCPFHRGTICSLCCSLDADCDDVCKPSSPGAKVASSAVF